MYVCPDCKFPLEQLCCRMCGAQYRQVDGIPVLLSRNPAFERAGINKFKKGFGGRQERTYDCTVPVSLRGRVWLPLRDAWHSLNSARK